MGCVLNDTQLKDLYDAMNDYQAYPDTMFLLGKMRTEIISALHELQRRREHPDLPDAEELLDLERLDREAQEDALLDTRPRPPYIQNSGGFMDATTFLLGETDDDYDPEW